MKDGLWIHCTTRAVAQFSQHRRRYSKVQGISEAAAKITFNLGLENRRGRTGHTWLKGDVKMMTANNTNVNLRNTVRAISGN